MPVYPSHQAVFLQIQLAAQAVAHLKAVLVRRAVIVVEHDHLHIGVGVFQIVLHPAPYVRVGVSAQIVHAVHHGGDHIVDVPHLEGVAHGAVDALEVRFAVAAPIDVVVVAYGVAHRSGHVFTVHAGKVGAQAVLVTYIARVHDKRRARVLGGSLDVFYPLSHAAGAHFAVRDLQEGVIGVISIRLFQNEVVALLGVGHFYVIILRPIPRGDGDGDEPVLQPAVHDVVPVFVRLDHVLAVGHAHARHGRAAAVGDVPGISVVFSREIYARGNARSQDQNAYRQKDCGKNLLVFVFHNAPRKL